MQAHHSAKRSPLPTLSRLFSSTSEPTDPIKPSRYSLPTHLKTAAVDKNLRHGSAAHAVAFKSNLILDSFIANSIVNMYSKCNQLDKAENMFDELLHRDTPTWNSIINGYFRHGFPATAFSCFARMLNSGVLPDEHSLSIVISGACNSLQLELGRQAHAYLLKNILCSDEFIATALINMYLNCDRLLSAIAVFRALKQEMRMNVPSVWNAMIGGLRHSGDWERSLEFFSEMKRWGVRAGAETYSALLAASSHGGNLATLEMIHGDAMKGGLEEEPYVCTSLVSVYGKLGDIESAQKVFAGAKVKKTELCNSMISAFVANGCFREAILIYRGMNETESRSDSSTIVNSLAACSSSSDLLEFGRMIHGELIKIPAGFCITVVTSLVTMYWRGGRVEESSALFESVEEKDEALWGSMIAGFCLNGKLESAVSLMNRMMLLDLKPDGAILASVASAAIRSDDEKLGFQIHGYSVKIQLETDSFVGSALVDLYAKSGLLEIASEVFAVMPEKNLVAWNSLISGHGRSGDVGKCIAALNEIRISGLAPDSISITGALVGASTSASLFSGKMIHAFQIRNNIEGDYQIMNSLIEMYARCGCLIDARQVFDRTEEKSKSVSTWNSMIAGYGSHGECEMAVSLFEMMKEKKSPDGITFLALISACNHRGLTDFGIYFFNLMIEEYKIEPEAQHYATVVDLLGRAGRLQEAYDLASDLQIDGEKSVWTNLICGSRFHRNVDAGEEAARRVSRLDAEDHVQMWKLYGEAGMAEKAAEERRRMKAQGLKKTPGCSWTEVGGRVEVFFSGGTSSLRQAEVLGVASTFKLILEEMQDILEDGLL